MAPKLTSNLETAYGKGLWNVTVKEYKGESTEELIANKRDKEIAKENPDVILFEPPFITDNSKLVMGTLLRVHRSSFKHFLLVQRALRL